MSLDMYARPTLRSRLLSELYWPKSGTNVTLKGYPQMPRAISSAHCTDHANARVTLRRNYPVGRHLESWLTRFAELFCWTVFSGECENCTRWERSIRLFLLPCLVLLLETVKQHMVKKLKRSQLLGLVSRSMSRRKRWRFWLRIEKWPRTVIQLTAAKIFYVFIYFFYAYNTYK